MGKEYTEGNQNVYFQARKEAASSNPKLYSREGAAEMLGISVSTLADYELGATKVVPVDKVMMMADLYGKPELRNGYCKHECPIGKLLPLASTIGGIEGISLRLLRSLDVGRINQMKTQLIDITADGVIEESEMKALREIQEQLDEMYKAISEFRLLTEKIGGRIYDG